MLTLTGMAGNPLTMTIRSVPLWVTPMAGGAAIDARCVAVACAPVGSLTEIERLPGTKPVNGSVCHAPSAPTRTLADVPPATLTANADPATPLPHTTG